MVQPGPHQLCASRLRGSRASITGPLIFTQPLEKFKARLTNGDIWAIPFLQSIPMKRPLGLRTCSRTGKGLGKPEKAAQRYANVGHSMYAQRRVELAKNAFQKAFDKYTRLGNPEGQAAQLSNLGMVAGDEGEYESAVDYFNRAAQLYREMRDPVGETNQTVRLAQVYLAGGKYDQAIGQYETALNRYREIGYSVGEADVLLEVGSLFCKKKEWQKGSECFGEAREIFTKNGRREKEALCLMMMAHADKGGASAGFSNGGPPTGFGTLPAGRKFSGGRQCDFSNGIAAIRAGSFRGGRTSVSGGP